MPDWGTPVAQNVNVDPNKGLQTISNLMGLKQQQQAITLQQQNIASATAAAQAQTQAMNEYASITRMMQTGMDDQGNSIRDENGEADVAKVLPALGRIAPYTGQQYAQNIIKTHNDKINLQSAAQALTAKEREILAGPLQAYSLNPNADTLDAAQESIEQWAEKHPEMSGQAQSALRLLNITSSQADPDKRAHMANSLSAMFQGGQVVGTQPQPATAQTGQQVMQGTVAPPAAGGAFKPATTIQQYPTPSTPTVTPSGAPAVLGAQPGIGTGTIKTGLSPTETGVATAVNADYTTTVAEARKAAQDVGVLQNISKYATGAVTGVATDRRAYLAGLAGLLGMTPEQMAKTKTDLLMKNENMLALAGGDTNLAKTLAESANPNVHMTPQAIKEAAQQVIAQKQLPIEKMHYMSQFTGDYKAYQNALNEWSANADPRVLQLPNMNQEERKQMATSMTAEERKNFQSKIRYFQSLGILR